jgi:dimethylargininase
MPIALTHVVSPQLDRCELTHRPRQPIDLPRAKAEHAAYCGLLAEHGMQVIELTVNRDFPDATFIEDTAVVVDEVAVLASMGTASRRGEVAGVAAALGKFRPLEQIHPPATLEGGDVLRIDRTLYVGLTTRTNREGAATLRELLTPHGYQIISVPVHGCLHLKSAVTALDAETLLMNPDWFDHSHLSGYRQVPIAAAEPWAANSLRLGETICLPSSFPQTAAKVTALGFEVVTIDISELMKAEAGLTCSSLIFAETRTVGPIEAQES